MSSTSDEREATRAEETSAGARRLRGGSAGVLLVVAFVLACPVMAYGLYVYPSWTRDYGHDIGFDKAMFGPAIEQPIAFSHRVHVTNKEIDCYYCHAYPERSQNAGLPTVELCLGCHDHIIPEHEEILRLKAYRDAGEEVPWVRVYYNPDHAAFPHHRHIGRGVVCRDCHGELERVDRLRKVTFYMGFCLRCHTERGAARDCTACHR